MPGSSARRADVLVVGAGPTGLVLALWLTRLGMRVRIIDKTSEPGTTSRALALQARTLELYSQVGLADAVVRRGRKIKAVNLWVSGKQKAHVGFGDLGKGLSPYPYALIFPQDEHERLLTERLAEAGVEVERGTELIDFSETPDGIRARLKCSDKTEQECEAAYVAGCDGAHSTVREALRIGFPGGVYEHLYYVADVEAEGAAINGEIHVALDVADFLAVFPLRDEGRARLVGTVREVHKSHQDLSWDDVSKRVIDWMRVDVRRVNWFSIYRVHHRVAEHFRKGRAFLIGDAGHIHSPVGGQGMNTGIGDAVNLSWKLAAVLKGAADASLLDSYEPERIAFARRLVATTDRAFTAVISPSAIARVTRMEIAPVLLPLAFRLRPLRRFTFRTISQTAVNYRQSALSEGSAGSVHAGDRLPWVRSEQGEQDNYSALGSLAWQVHVYGDAAADVRTCCERLNLPLIVFPWRREAADCGLGRDAVYLVRPDGYVAMAAAENRTTALNSYLEARGLTFSR